MLRDIRVVFYALQIKTISSEDLLTQLHALEVCSLEDGETWGFWKGENRTRNAHALSKNEMFAMLHTFKLNTKTVRIAGRKQPDRGYNREQFVPFWEKYCSDEEASQGTAPKSLVKH